MRRSGGVLAGLVAALLVAGQVLASGWLDPSFGSNGVVRLQAPVAFDRAATMLLSVAGTGRVYVAATFEKRDNESGYLFARSSTGAVVPTFFSGKPVPLGTSSDQVFVLYGLFGLPDGGVVTAAGSHGLGVPFHIRVTRRSATGAVVKSTLAIPGLGTDEVTATQLIRLPGGSLRLCVKDVSGEVRLTGLTSSLGPDDRLGPDDYAVLDGPVACGAIGSDALGHVYLASPRHVVDHFVTDVRRFNAHGVPDTDWGDAGVATVETAGHDVTPGIGPVGITGDGSMLVPLNRRELGPGNRPHAQLLRLDAAGEPVDAWGTDGIVTFGPTDDYGSRLFALDVDSAGRTVLSETNDFNDGAISPFLSRLTLTGVPDSPFGFGGSIHQTRAPRGLEVISSDRILVVAPDRHTVLLTRRTG